MTELKPCPFCGHEVHLDRTFYSLWREYAIYCENCDMWFTLDDVYAHEEDIVEAWNRSVNNERTN